jgi:hypothetical protein
MNAPFDMASTIIAKSDQLNADDLIGGPRTITVRKVSAGESAEQPVNVYYNGDDNKPFRPCKTVRRIMVAMWGADANSYIGRSMTIVRDASVSFGGMQVGGIRITHMSHIDGEQTVVVMKTKGKKAPIKIAPLKVAAKPVDAPAPTSADSTKAEAWTASHIAAIESAPDAMDLGILEQQAANGLARLKAEHPELLAKINAAKAAKLASFGGEPSDETWRTNVLGAG